MADKDSASLPHYKEINSEQSLRDIAQNFASSEGDYHKVFKSAFVKLSELGSNYEDLTDVEYFLSDHEDFHVLYSN